MAFLNIQDLKIYYKTIRGDLKAVDGISFTLEEGKNLGLVGESGCGKTTAAKAILRLLPENGRIAGGKIIFRDQDIAQLSYEKMRRLRWNNISMISQSAMNALNPVIRIDKQIIEAIRTHENTTKKETLQRAVELFKLVGLEAKRLKAFPHELSGGMRQRAIIAMALALDPDIIIADEPTTALDVVVQDKILKKILTLQDQFNSSMILITHDISVVAEICDKICIMYAGKVMEFGTTSKVLKDPRHPYTMGLKNAFPSILLEQKELISIPGYPPDLVNPPIGCPFFNRCPFGDEKCKDEQPPREYINDDHWVYCHYADQYQDFREKATQGSTWEAVRKRQQELGVV